MICGGRTFCNGSSAVGSPRHHRRITSLPCSPPIYLADPLNDVVAAVRSRFSPLGGDEISSQLLSPFLGIPNRTFPIPPTSLPKPRPFIPPLVPLRLFATLNLGCVFNDLFSFFLFAKGPPPNARYVLYDLATLKPESLEIVNFLLSYTPGCM